MANDVDLSSLIIEVDAEAGAAGRNIDAVASALSRLNAGSKLTRTINNLERLSSAMAKFQGLNAAANSMTKISVAVQRLSGIQKLSGLNSALNTLGKMPSVVSGLDTSRLTGLANAVQPLTQAMQALNAIGKPSGLNSALNALNKIPKITNQLKAADLDAFARQIEHVKTAIAPLASEMEKVSRGFSALPANIQRAIQANAKLTTSNTKVSKSFTVLGTKIPNIVGQFTIFGFAVDRVATWLGDALYEFNSFVENVNLFSVSMGDFVGQASEFTQSMQDILGVDASEAMRNMGVIQNLTTSFGVAADQAYVLSKNITQLGYDFASFFNISTEDAFTKLQAAISGELEPIRRLGVDISEARLQQELFALGIDATVKNLSQADKALLRYIAIMKQTGNAQTDMARTLNSPANQIRVFQQQITLLVRSIGSLLIPMLNALLPPLIAVTVILREVISGIATFLGVSVEFADVSASIGTGNVSSGLDDVADSASGAAKEMSYLIGGFDELNVMNKDMAGAGAGAGVDIGGNLLGDVKLPEYDMFAGLIESRVNQLVKKIKDFGKKVVDFLKPVIPFLKAIAAGFVAAFAVSKIATFVSWLQKLFAVKSLTGLFGDFIKAFQATDDLFGSAAFAVDKLRKSLSLAAKIGVGVGGFVAAFVGAYDVMKKLGEGVFTVSEAFGSLALVLGVVGTALYIFLGPVGLVITAVGALVGGFLGYRSAMQEAGQAAYEASDLHLVMAGVLERVEERTERAAAAMESLQTKVDAVSDAAGQYTFAKALADDIFDLSEKTDKSAYDMLELKTKVDMLNGLGIEGLQVSLNETGTAVEQVRDNIYEVIDALEQQALMAAYQDVLTEAYKQNLQAQLDLVEANRDYQASMDAWITAGRDLNEYYSSLDAIGKLMADLGLDDTYASLKAALEETGAAVDGTKQNIEDSAAVFEETQGLIATYSELVSGMSGSFDTAGASAQQFSEDLKNALAVAGVTDVSGLGETTSTGSMASSGAAIGGALTAGLAQGVQAGTASATEAIAAMSDSVVSAAKTELGIHSPSTKFADVGKNVDAGLAKGITENAEAPLSALTDMLNAMLAKLEQFSANFAAGVNDTLASYAAAMASLQTDGTSVTFVPMPSVSVPRLASGGVLTSPQLVLAGEYAGASSNPEIVAPQSIMRQTVAEANADMVLAIVAAIQSLEDTVVSTSENPTPTVIELDGERIYDNQKRVAARRGYPVSKNPNFGR